MTGADPNPGATAGLIRCWCNACQWWNVGSPQAPSGEDPRCKGCREQRHGEADEKGRRITPHHLLNDKGEHYLFHKPTWTRFPVG